MSILVGIPTHGRDVDAGVMMASHAFGDVGRVEIKWSAASLLAANFNKLLCAAKNGGHEYLLLGHGDVVPLGTGWLRAMVDRAKRHNADLLSAVVPLKNASGLTSTAVLVDGRVRRLTLHEVAKLPDVFDVFDVYDVGVAPDAYGLLVNTGLLLIRMAMVDPERLHFTVRDQVRQCEGVFNFVVWPEDWGFSVDAAKANLRVTATRTPRVEHIGAVEFSTAAEPWGLESDPNRGEVL